MILNSILVIILLIIISLSLFFYKNREGLDQIMKNKQDIKELKKNIEEKSSLKDDVNNLETMENKLNKNIKKFTKRMQNISYAVMNTTSSEAPNPPESAAVPEDMYN